MTSPPFVETAAPAYACWSGYGDGSADEVTINFGATSFAESVPSGFTAWDASGATTFDPAWAGSGITLSNGNLTATRANASSWSTTRSTTEKLAGGKWYWEVSCVTISSTIGVQAAGITTPINTVMSGGQPPGNGGGVNNSGCCAQASPSGNFTNNGSTSSVSGVTWTNGQTICLAVDLDARLFWVRNGPGNWNGSGTANPATGTGGFAMVGLGYGPVGLTALVNTAITSEAVTLQTANVDDVIMVLVSAATFTSAADPVPSVTSVTASGLTFSKRHQVNPSAGSTYNSDFEVWWAPATATFNGTITVNFSGFSGTNNALGIIAFGVSGANNYLSPWDSEAGLPYTGTTWSTAQANDLILAVGVFNAIATPNQNPTPSGGPTWTQLGTNEGGENGSATASVSAYGAQETTAQSGITTTWSNADAVYIDAITAEPTGGTETSTGSLAFGPLGMAGDVIVPESGSGVLAFGPPGFAGSAHIPDNGAGALAFGPIGMAGEALDIPGGSETNASQLPVLILADDGPPPDRASQAAVLILAEPPPPPAQASQAAIMALAEVIPSTNASQAVLLALVGAEPCVTKRCDIWLITRKDGVQLAFTSHDQDVVFNGLTAQACGSLMAGATEYTGTLDETGSITLNGIISSEAIDEEDLYAGLYDDAFVEVWRASWDLATPETPIRMAAGWVGSLEHGEAGWQTDVLGPSQRMSQQSITSFFTPSCRWVFGSPQCGFDFYPVEQACTVITSPNRGTIYMDLEGPDVGFVQWNNGSVLFTSGKNSGIVIETKTVSFDDDGQLAQIITWLPVPFPLLPGDTFLLRPGCDKSVTACQGYDLFLNYGGFPDVAGQDAIVQLPTANY